MYMSNTSYNVLTYNIITPFVTELHMVSMFLQDLLYFLSQKYLKILFLWKITGTRSVDESQVKSPSHTHTERHLSLALRGQAISRKQGARGTLFFSKTKWEEGELFE